MNVPVGFLAKLWSLASFLPFFVLLLLLGSAKGNQPTPEAAIAAQSMEYLCSWYPA